jgi:murein DD-endopeptidase MepM/ murein hydrolase activator NlpD
MRVLVIAMMLVEQNVTWVEAQSVSLGNNVEISRNSFYSTQSSISNYPGTTQADVVVADGFDLPVRNHDGKDYFPGYRFLDWAKGYDSWHPGYDFNWGNEDADRGDPVYAVANGKVIFSGKIKNSSWGQVILIEHVLPNGKKVWSQYAHLLDRKRYPNDAKDGVVVKGELIGHIGDADGYPKFVGHDHLHFEIRIKRLDAWSWPTGWPREKIKEHYADPIKFINSNRKVLPPCPETGGIIFYAQLSNDKPNACGGKGEGEGYFIVDPKKIPYNFVVDPNNPNPGIDDTTKTIYAKFYPQSVRFPESDPSPATDRFKDNVPYLIRTLLPTNFVLDANIDPANQSQKPVIQWEWHGQSQQRWQFQAVDQNYYRIKSLYYNQCLGTGEKIGPSDRGYKVVLKECAGEDTKWKIESLSGNGSYRIRSSIKNGLGEDLALDVPDSSSIRGTGLVVWPVDNQKKQEWHFCELNQIKLEINYQDGRYVKLIDNTTESQNITDTVHIKSMYLTGNECSILSINSLANTASCTPNIPPNFPTLESPVQFGQLNEPPDLVWNNNGDPDNNSSQLDFQVEVSGASQIIYSEWIKNVVWKPSELSEAYGTYQWRVRARDPELALSEWSASRSFTILSPNGLPQINFQTANGSISAIIYTRQTTWTFLGTASDPEGKLNRVEWRCSGDDCGSQTSHSGTTSWSHTQTGLSGQNDIYFVAYDNYTANNSAGQSAASRHLDLRIDLAAPTTTPGLNGQSNAALWPAWFTAPVNVTLNAKDNGTGRAVVGMGKIHYQVDGGLWQVVSGSATAFTISSDGNHAVNYYSEDALGNIEATRSFTFKIDQTPPSLPTNIQETHGVVSDQWQKAQNIPSFTWDAASDATSGLLGYQFYFGSDPNGIGYTNILASEPRQWTPFPAGMPTGTYYLRARTQDNAKNWSAWATLFTFRYDNTPPENPADVTHSAGITTTWQNTTNIANFTWPRAHDEGSGVQGYYVYWGLEPAYTSTVFISADAYQNLTPLCAANSACTGYLRLRSVDAVGNLAEDWNTVFILRYDNAPPLLDFTFNGGVTNTTQSQVVINVNASDLGSGVYAARFSADGQNWTDWEQPTTERLWNVPPISRQAWPVYVQVKDHVGLLSQIVTHDVYLDVNPARPRSVNYRLFDQSLSAGSGPYASANYIGRGTLGQVADSPAVTSTHYTLWNGYEAGSQSIPLIVPGHDEYTFTDGIFASGVVADTLQSASYQMIFTVGGIGLSPITTISSASYQHQPGFLAAYQPPKPLEQILGDPPNPEPALACDALSVAINGGAAYTDNPNVTLNLCAPYAVEMMLSEHEDFAGASWEPFAATKAWTIASAGSTVAPRFVYAQFKEADGKIHATYFDDILYDPNQPSGALLLTDDIVAEPLFSAPQWISLTASEPTLLQADADGSVTLYVDGSDDNSGMSEMQLSQTVAFTDTIWQPFAPVVNYLPTGGDGYKTIYARFRDEAGNLSSVTAINFIYDTQAPEGYIFADPWVLPGDAITTTIYLGDYSYWWDEGYTDEITPTETTEPPFEGPAMEMRLGNDPTMTNAYWQPITDTLVVPVDATLPEGIFYAQYRDAAGNISEVVSTTYQIDTFAPMLFAAAEPGVGVTRTVNIYATDDLAGVEMLYLSNDPLMQTGVIATTADNEGIVWTFDDNKVVWIVAVDGVGNRSEPYPVYATDALPAEPMDNRVYLPLVVR